ncbi:MAG: helix-turn-helix domain-containing protein [Isosphaeraceae bacterium]
MAAVRTAPERDLYIELVQRFPLRRLRSDAELDEAIAIIDRLVTRERLAPGESDYLDVLSDLVHKYESTEHPISPASDAEVLRFLLESNEMAQTELAHRSGIAGSTISEILGGKRKLSRRHIAALSRVFRVSPAVFFPEAVEMTLERAAEILSRRTGLQLSRDFLVSLGSAFAWDRDGTCWRALQELAEGERPGTPPAQMAIQLNALAQKCAESSCWWPVSFHLKAADIQALGNAFSSDRECWRVFRAIVEEAVEHVRPMRREWAEEN